MESYTANRYQIWSNILKGCNQSLIRDSYFLFQISTLASIMPSLVPFVMLILFNLLIYCLIRSKSLILPRSSVREKRDLRVAMILILIIIVYIACHGIITYINIIELRAIITGKILYFRLFTVLSPWQVLLSHSCGVTTWTSWSPSPTCWSRSAALLTLPSTAAWSVCSPFIKFISVQNIVLVLWHECKS